MTDTVDKATRSRIMSNIKSTNTKIEIAVRKALFAKGFRYKINDKTLPGKPDIVLPKYKAIIFVNGCFWHGHNCSKGKIPKSNIMFWQKKIKNNKKRDNLNIKLLNKQNWKVAIVWQCSLIGKRTLGIEKTVEQLEIWLNAQTPENIQIPILNKN